MGDAAGELADRLHLLALPKQVLGLLQRLRLLLLPGEIPPDGVDEPFARHRGPGDPAVAAVLAAVTVVEPPERGAFEQELQAVARPVHILGMEKIQQAAADQVGFGPAEARLPRRIDGDDGSVEPGHEDEVGRELPQAVAVQRPFGDLPFQRPGEIAQAHLRPPPLDGRARPVGDVAREGDLLRRPAARLGMVDEEQRDEHPLFEDRQVDQRPDRERAQGRGPGRRARVFRRVLDDHGHAAFQVVDVGAEIAEPQGSGEAGHSGRAPVALYDDRLACRIDGAVAGTARAERPTQDGGGGETHLRRVVEVAQPVPKLDLRQPPDLGLFDVRDVAADGH